MVIGFVAKQELSREKSDNAKAALDKVLRYFPWLNRLSLKVGETEITLWGHGDLEDCLHRLPDGTLLALIGSPIGDISLSKAWDSLKHFTKAKEFKLPWDGRFILLKVSADGRKWTMWNDWCGSIPVFHARIGERYIASTLDPVVVAAGGYKKNDFFLPGLVLLLLNGHYLGDWTLFKSMKIVQPDCVARWDNNEFKWERMWTVEPSQKRWNEGWDNLIDDMYRLSRKSITEVLKTQSSWILPLSGGLDSRLIAAVAAEMEINLHSYTYGPTTWSETICAKQVAKVLNIPWKSVDLGTRYLARYTQMWADWFGSALHFHGMYQMPFLESLNTAPPGPILQGFLGDPLAGNHLRNLCLTYLNKTKHSILPDSWTHWSIEEVKSIVKFPVTDVFKYVIAQVEKEITDISGEKFQQLMFFDFWNRQRLFISYQPTMYDYWRGVGTPFFNREYASFCMSLPRIALENRCLQKEMFRRYFPDMAAIGGTYAHGETMRMTARYAARRALAWRLPRLFRIGPLREFNPTHNTLESDCIRATKHEAAWPIFEAKQKLDEWIDMDAVNKTYKAAMGGDNRAVCKLMSVQAVAYRLLHY